MPDTKTPPSDDAPLDPALERHLSDPSQMTEQVSGQQQRPHENVPTDPAVDTENQPS